ncbi:hypothetical protein [Bradyrhizobium sp. WD16]|uniref:hypothetical protein n=1 Tax=Bradyrhizobium sp. WD16 TaxID=1521768 RepID=UPI0020A5C090|nr:hypothetical protein [Bradyrhizobium sp. WD16]UTD28647.1 hypothetical protein DB459_18845 [Bradyrhizobium sp. WD16]
MAVLFSVWIVLTAAWFAVLIHIAGLQQVLDSLPGALVPPVMLLAIWIALNWAFTGTGRP